MDKSEKIAKRIMTGAGLYKSISDDILKFCESEMEKHADGLDYDSKVWSQDGRSYDGYISFTEGDAHCDMFINGWDLFDIKGCEKRASEYAWFCKECFVSDSSALFDSREIEGYGKLKDLDFKEQMKLLDDEENCPDDIRSAFEDYESEWMSDEYGVLSVEVQFHLDKSSSEDGWNVNVYAYVGDEYGKNKLYLYEDAFYFKEGEDPRKELSEQITKAFQAL